MASSASRIRKGTSGLPFFRGGAALLFQGLEVAHEAAVDEILEAEGQFVPEQDRTLAEDGRAVAHVEEQQVSPTRIELD